jgi:Reverse transcriptase (RNA-dependent DNA polymerase)
MARYADDFVILCRTREEAQAALEDVRAWVNDNGLALNAEKTHIGDCRLPGQGFAFLGYRFEAGRRHVRKKSLAKLKDSIRAKTKRTRGDSLARIVADLNPDAARLVRLLQARPSFHFHQARRVHPPTAARPSATAGEALLAHGNEPRRPSTLAKCLLRGSRTVRSSHGLAVGATVSMTETPDWRAGCGVR